MGIVFNEHSKVPIADVALHDYGRPVLGHTSATVERYGLRYASVSTNTCTSTNRASTSTTAHVVPRPGTPAHWHTGTLTDYDHDKTMEPAALAHTKNNWGLTMGHDEQG